MISMNSMVPCSLAFSLLLSPAPAPQADRAVKSVSITVEMRPNPAPTFAIVNHYPAPIEAFHFRIDLGRPTLLSYDADMSRTVQTPPADHGPIQPGERRLVEYDPHTDLSNAKLNLDGLVFGDGHYEGDPIVLQKWFADRDVLAEDLRYWIAVVDALPGHTNSEISAYLRQRDIEHQRDTPADASKVRASVRSLLTGTPPEGRLDQSVATLRARTAVRLEMATRHLHPPAVPATPDTGEKSAEISMVPDAFLDAVAVIRNHGRLPLETWWVVPTSPTTKLPELRMDECTLSGAPPNRGNTTGPIPAGGSRELVMFKGDMLPPGTNVTATLSLVIFSDLSFEGPLKNRDAAYRSRERQAGERTFWIDALNTALTQPASAIAVLQAKVEESQRRGDAMAPSMQSNVRNLESLFHRMPEQIPKSLTTMRDRFEHERTLLLRHVAK
jgi:hypothetical protein